MNSIKPHIIAPTIYNIDFEEWAKTNVENVLFDIDGTIFKSLMFYHDKRLQEHLYNIKNLFTRFKLVTTFYPNVFSTLIGLTNEELTKLFGWNIYFSSNRLKEIEIFLQMNKKDIHFKMPKSNFDDWRVLLKTENMLAENTLMIGNRPNDWRHPKSLGLLTAKVIKPPNKKQNVDLSLQKIVGIHPRIDEYNILKKRIN